MRYYYLVFLLLAFCISAQAQSGSNIVKGKITFVSSTKSTFKRGASYDTNATTASAEKKRINALNSPKKNIYISLHPLDFKPSLKKVDAQMTQREETFTPNIVAVTKGSKVYFLNEDEQFHNIYSLTPKARFNIGRRPPGNVYAQRIDKVGVVKLGCDIHPEMGAVVLSLDTPYFTKIKNDGTFQLSGLPDGNYELRAFHPAYRSYSAQVKCTGGTATIHNIKL